MSLSDTPPDLAALQTARRAVREGGAIAKARLGDPGSLTWKGRRLVVSQAALDVQDAIVAAIHSDHRGAAVLAREGPDEASLPVDAEPLWIVNPICGSLNFIQGVPHVAVSVAWRSHGAIRAAAVYDPCRDELFEATLGTASALNGRTIHVQQNAEGIEAWQGSLIGTDWPAADDLRRRAGNVVALLADQVLDCHLMGSPSLGVCQVAAGRLHAYWHLDLSIWEVAAPGLILQRAGGLLTDARGMSWLHSDGSYLATNAIVHASLQNTVQTGLTLPVVSAAVHRP